MDEERIERTLKEAKVKLAEEGIELSEDELRDEVIKSLEKTENEYSEKLQRAIKEAIEQPLSNEKHWKLQAVGYSDRYVVINKVHSSSGDIIFPNGVSALFMTFHTKEEEKSEKFWLLDSKFSEVEPRMEAARWLGIGPPPLPLPVHEDTKHLLSGRSYSMGPGNQFAGTMIGNGIATILIVISALVGFLSLEASSMTFLSIAYLVWLFILATNFFGKPPTNTPMCQRFTTEEIRAYLEYHSHIWYPEGAAMHSSLLNALRFAGFTWAGLCFWKGYYWLGAASIAYYFLSKSVIVDYNPGLWMRGAAQKGNPWAIKELSLIDSIRAKQRLYVAERKASGTEE